MFVTIEELYAFKASYAQEIAELERKMSVVDEFIKFAEAKEPVETQNDEEVEPESFDTEENTDSTVNSVDY